VEKAVGLLYAKGVVAITGIGLGESNEWFSGPAISMGLCGRENRLLNMLIGLRDVWIWRTRRIASVENVD
jgi:hypothetical protein